MLKTLKMVKYHDKNDKMKEKPDREFYDPVFNT